MELYIHVPHFCQPASLLSQALSLKEAEKSVLSDRVSTLQAELSAAALEAERMCREAGHCKDQEQVTTSTSCLSLLSVVVFSSLFSVSCAMTEFIFVFLSSDHSRGFDQRAAGASLSVGGCSCCSRARTPESARGLCRPTVTCRCCSQRGRRSYTGRHVSVVVHYRCRVFTLLPHVMLLPCSWNSAELLFQPTRRVETS